MYKRVRFFVFIIFLFVLICVLFFIFHTREIPMDNTGFTLVNDMTVEVYSDVRVSSKIEAIDGDIVEDKQIDTSHLGVQTIEFLYKNKKGKKRRGSVQVEVVDTTEPIILMSNSYSVTVGYDKNLTDVIVSADNYDSTPTREIIGEYDMNQVGSYFLTYKVTDSSGNVAIQDFILYVKEKNYISSTSTYTKFEDIVSLYKSDTTRIGIDVSKWQGDIDFKQLKNAGVEFIIIRVGTGEGFHGLSLEDPYFKQNIEGATSVGIPVGIYYYSYATTKEEAKEQATWVIDKLKGYQIDLPIAFDWESWSYFNGLDLSLYEINEVADTFLQEIKNLGYDGILYGSKYYLNNIWKTTESVWLAHYTSKTDYEGSYKLWQLCDNGKVSGIKGAVDINIMYN